MVSLRRMMIGNSLRSSLDSFVSFLTQSFVCRRRPLFLFFYFFSFLFLDKKEESIHSTTTITMSEQQQKEKEQPTATEGTNATATNTHHVLHREMKHGPLMVCGCSTTFILFAVGLSSLVVASIEYANANNWDSAVNCGYNGRPPLLEWVFGTGIAYLIICCAYLNVSKAGDDAGSCAKCVVILSNTFLFAWMIVGAVSLWRDGKDCEQRNITLWRMGYSAVIISIVLVCCGGYTSYESTTVVQTTSTNTTSGGGGGGDVEDQK